MPQEFEKRLTATEAGVLWAQYLNTTMSLCVLTHFLDKNEDQEVGQVVGFTHQAMQAKAERIREIFKSDNYPAPIGFTEGDVNIDAPSLYSDLFYLAYARDVARIGLAAYGLSLTTASREDIRRHFQTSITEAIDIDERAIAAQKSKGVYMRGPYISSPEHPEFVQDTDYLGSLWGSKRPLSAIEISSILVSSQNNMIGEASLMGFAQVAQSKELREFFLRGKRIAHKHAELLNGLLTSEDMPAPTSLGSYVTNSIEAPFSDKLMLQYTALVMQAGVSYYGTALAFTARTDLTGTYTRLMTELMQYLEDALILQIRNRWMEQPPLAVDRRALVLR